MAFITPLQTKPGIKRDGTMLEGEYYTDGLWVRFQRSKPRKILGYRRLNNLINSIPRTIFTLSREGYTYVYVGQTNKLEVFRITPSGTVENPVDITPAGFAVNSTNTWHIEAMYDVATNQTSLVAHCHPSLDDISEVTATPIYYGDAFAMTALTSTGTSVAGGICVFQPYLIALDSYGVVKWSVPNKPNDFTNAGSGTARVAATKFICGVPLRAGAGNAPGGLLFSLDSVIRVSFVGTVNGTFDFDTISAETSLLSENGVMEYDGVFYWPAIDRFVMFNGVVRELPNDMNQNWFFDNLNYNARNKVFAFKIPRFGEIWYCYPRGDATECTHAVIFNVREGTWYDTPLPNGFRSCGYYAQSIPYPLLGSPVVDATTGGYKVWQHEFGVDEVDGDLTNAIQSYFVTNGYTARQVNATIDRSLVIEAVEPDFLQTGPMTVVVTGQANVRAPIIDSAPFTFEQTASDAQAQIVRLRETRRQLYLKFESNVAGGDYQMGMTLMHISPSDGRQES